MSTLKVGALQGISASSDAITLANDGTCTANITNNLSNRNKIINGSMICSQRGSSFTNIGDTNYSLDRFTLDKSNTGAAFTITQSTTSPNGFAKSLKLDVTTVDNSTAANEFVALRHKIEAQNLQDLAYGTSAAKALVLSFYVRSNVTGTYGITCLQRDNSSKLYARTYTINSVDTWERKTISIPADTSGVINDDNGSGFEIYFSLIMGSNYKTGSISSAWETYADTKIAAQHGVNVAHSLSNNWYLTGVQLEVDHTGSGVATDFEHLSFADELRRCQRYLYTAYQGSSYSYITGANDQAIGAGWAYSSSEIDLVLHFPVQLRNTPTVTQANAGYSVVVKRPSGDRYIDSGGWNGQLNAGRQSTRMYATTGSSRLSGSLTEGTTYFIFMNSGSVYLRFDAEL